MNAFRFRLQKVLEWRETELEQEEIQFKKCAAALAEIDRRREELAASANRAEFEVRQGSVIAGRDLAALGAYRLHVRSKEKELAAARAESEKKLLQQKGAMLEARRRCRLLERLKERRQEEWTTAHEREMEELASDSFLSQWNRRQA